MAIQYYKLKRKVFSGGRKSYRYVARRKVETVIDLDKIVSIVVGKCSASRGDILSVLAETETAIAWMLEEGHPVRLNLLGTFFPAIEARSCNSPEEVTRESILKFRCLFKPSKYLRDRFKAVRFVLADNEVHEVKDK